MKYLGFYDDSKTRNKRLCSPAAVSKMDYLISVLLDLGYDVEVISLAAAMISSTSEHRMLLNGGKLHLFSSFGFGNKVKNKLNKYFILIQALLYLFRTGYDGETIIVYHSLDLMLLVSILKRFKHVRIIYDVGELYSTVIRRSKQRELFFLRSAEAYIFSTSALCKQINQTEEPFTILHGTYLAAANMSPKLFSDGRIHCVFSGTFDIRKGVLSAIRAAKYLDSRYHIHVLGFGTDDEIQTIKETIQETIQSTECRITFDGTLYGNDYKQFLQSCEIGLSPQDPTATFNDASFPSKILSYLSNGLKVVSIRISAVEESKIGPYLFYFDNQTPQAIAEAILAAEENNLYDGREICRKLDAQFHQEFELLLNHFKSNDKE